MGSDPDLSLSDLDLDIPDGSGSDEIDLSEFQLGTAKPDLAGQTGDIDSRPSGSDEHDVLLDDLSLPPGPLSELQLDDHRHEAGRQAAERLRRPAGPRQLAQGGQRLRRPPAPTPPTTKDPSDSRRDASVSDDDVARPTRSVPLGGSRRRPPCARARPGRLLGRGPVGDPDGSTATSS